MRKLMYAVLVFFVFTGSCFAAGECVPSYGHKTKHTAELVFTCTGDSVDGSVPNSPARGKASMFRDYPWLVRVIVENLTTQTDVTANSDVYLYNKSASGADLLAGDGVDQLDSDTLNYIRLSNYEPMPKQIWLGVSNQSEASGQYTVTLVLSK